MKLTKAGAEGASKNGADPPPAEEDGLLQVREISHLQLHADLVALSACETGIGQIQGEAGVISLEHAFLLAGARAVVASLWKVEDWPTTELMEAFYRHLEKNEDEATALTRSKQELANKYSDTPYYWAGFILTGDGASRVHRHL